MSYILQFIFFAALFGALLGPISILIALLFIYQSFGSMALIPPELVGGSSLTPGSIAAAFFVAKALGSRAVFKNSVRVALDFRRLGLLTLFLVIAVLGAYVLPRIFAGSVHVYTMRTADLEFVSPSIANITQAAYLILSSLTAIVVAASIQNPKFMNSMLIGILLGAWAVIFTGILDIAATRLGLEEVLSYFRTANYVFMTENYVAGTRRIIGLMPEASIYGALAVSFCGMLLFLRPAYPPHLWKWHVPIAAWGCGLMAMLSTSSTAYGMMAVLLSLYAFYNAHRISSDGKIIKKPLPAKFLALIGMAVLGLLVLVFDRELAEHFVNLINTLLFEKQKSTSYADRTGLTLAAVNTFFESDGFGVGVGSVRTSNFFVNVLASTGVLGTALFGAFLWVVFTRRAAESEAGPSVIVRAGKLSLLPIFAGLAVSGTTPDFGPLVGMIFGIIIGLSRPAEKPQWVSPHLGKQKEKTRVPRKKRKAYI